jgi:hypothetical protein
MGGAPWCFDWAFNLAVGSVKVAKPVVAQYLIVAASVEDGQGPDCTTEPVERFVDLGLRAAKLCQLARTLAQAAP